MVVEQRAENEKLIARYLLGDLPEDELRHIEDRYFADDDFFEEVSIVEEELIDDYVRGKLAGNRREQFENSFLTSPARRERVEFSRTLMKSVSNVRADSESPRRESGFWLLSIFPGRNRALQFALGAVALVVAAGVVWLVLENLRLRNDVNSLKVERARLEQKEKEMAEQTAQQSQRNDELKAKIESDQNERQQLEQQLARLQPQPVALFELDSRLTRGSDATKSFNIPGGAKTVELKLYLEPGDYKIFRAILQTDSGEKVWSKTSLKAQTSPFGKVIVARLPAELFSNRQYTLTLGGAASGNEYEDMGIYSFKVAKK